MQTINIEMPVGVNEILLVPLADLHIGEPACDLNAIKREIQRIAETPNCYTILNGDIIDNAIRTSIGDVYSQVLNPQEQLELATKLFTPIKDKILAITNGNHEERSYRDSGIDLLSCLAMSLGLEKRYANEGAFIFLNFTIKSSNGKIRRQTATVYATHGRGGGRKEGAKAIRLADMASIIDADVYIHSHTHMPMVMKQVHYRVSRTAKAVEEHERVFVNTAAFLNYAKYAEKCEYKPNSKSNPNIIIGYCYTSKRNKSNKTTGILTQYCDVVF